jgi:hypothetical protein
VVRSGSRTVDHRSGRDGRPCAPAWTTRQLETVIVAFATFAVFAAYVWSSRYWIDLVDEGYFVYLASRVQQGELPYRDFDTYYTPGVFYLYAAAFDLFGVGVMPVRILMAGVRTLCGLLLYLLTRRVATWPFAVLPFLAVVAMDPVPIHPEPHPAWWALLATLVGLKAIVAHTATRRLRWVALAGAAAAVAFCFKQNVGAFAALAVGGYLLLRPRDRAGRLVVVSQALYVALLALAATVLLRPALDAFVAAAIWLPLLATLTLLLWQAWAHASPVGWVTGLDSVVAECALASAALVGVTVLWLVPLVSALGLERTPFGLFVGASVNQGALILPLAPPPRAAREVALVAIWAPLGFAMLFGERSRRRVRHLVAIGLGASLLVPLIPTLTGPSEPLAEDPGFYPWLNALNGAFSTLFLFVPALGAWAGLATVGARVGRGASAGIMPWYLLVGTLTALAIYPRADFLHTVFAGPPLLVVGAWALSRAHGALAGPAGWLGRATIFAALLVVPTAAVAPHVFWRYVTIVHADPRSPTPPPYVPLGLERAPVLVPRHFAERVRGAVELVRAGTPPGDPFFAYPAAPLFNFLADRPNPTRFNHFLPSALTAEELAEVIASLEVAKPRYVLWDHSQVVNLGTEPANRPLSDYIWRCYEPVTSLSPFVILERRAC